MAAPAGRFVVEDGEIVDTKERQIISLDQLAKLAPPGEQARIASEIQASGWEGADQTADPSIMARATTSTPAQSSASPSEPLPSRPSLDQFMEVAKADNPDVSDRDLRKYWAQHYSDINPKSLPTLEAFLPAAKEDNPDVPESQLRAYWQEHYGDLGAAEKETRLGVTGTLWEGAKSAGRSLKAAGQALIGDSSGVVDTAKAQQSAPRDTALENLLADIQKRKESLGKDPSWLATAGELGKAALSNPKGAGLLLAEQLPNSAIALGSAAAGAAAGSFLGPVGTIAGGLAGLFGANTALETGSKAIEAGADQTFTPDERSRVLKEGAIKGGIITGVDAATFGLTNWITGTTARAVERATAKALTDAGVDTTDKAAVLAARNNPDIFTAVQTAQQRAEQGVNALGQRLARGSGALGAEAIGEGAGEYIGEYAATGQADKMEAVIEAFAGLGQSAGEVAFTHGLNRKRTDASLLTGQPPAALEEKGKTPTAAIPAALGVGNPDVGLDETIKTAWELLNEDTEAQEKNAIEAQRQAERQLTQGPEPAVTIPRPGYDVPILQAAQPGPEPVIAPGQAFTPRQAPEPDPRDTIRQERQGLIGRVMSKAPEEVIRKPDSGSSTEPAPDVPLQSAADLAYPPSERDRMPSQQDLLLRQNRPQPRSGYEVPTLPAAQQAQPSAIVPGSAFVARNEAELTPKERIAHERAKLVAMKAKQPAQSPTTTDVPKSQEIVDRVLPSAIDRAYPSVSRLHELAKAKGFDIDSPVFRTMTKMATGKEHLDSLSPAERDKFAATLNKLTAKQTPEVVTSPTKQALKPVQPTAPSTDAVTAPRSALPPEKNAEMLLRAEKGKADLEIDQSLPETSLVDFLKQKGGIQDQGGELSTMEVDGERKPFSKNLINPKGLTLDDAAELAHESGYIQDRDISLLLQGIDRETRGQGGTADWYKQLTTGPKPLSREAIDIAIGKIIKDHGVDTGKAVERVKAALLNDGEFDGSQWGEDAAAILRGDWPSWIAKPEAPSQSGSVQTSEPVSASPPTEGTTTIAPPTETATTARVHNNPSEGLQTDAQIDIKAHEAAPSPTNDRPEPSEAQIEAGNYKKGHLRIAGLDISVENPEGSTRSGTDPNGKAWSVTMQSHYGYIRGTKGKDKEHIDVFVKPGTPEDYNGPVFVIDQENANGSFDEHKVVIGASSMDEAVQLYEANYSDDVDRIRSVKTFTMSEFKLWLKAGNHTRPAGTIADYRRDRKPKSEVAPEVAPSDAETKPAQPETKPAEGEPFALTSETIRQKKETPAPAEQLSIDVPPPTVGEKPIIGREVTPEEAPLFSEAAKQPDEEQLDITNDQEKAAPEVAPTPTEILASALRTAADQIEGRKAERKADDDLTDSVSAFDNMPPYEQRPNEPAARNRALAREALASFDRIDSVRDTEGVLGRPRRSRSDRPESERLAGLERAGIRTPAVGISKDLATKGRVDLRGYTVNSMADLAMIAQVFRNPRVETLRFFYVKDGKVVGHEGISSRLPGSSMAFPISSGDLESMTVGERRARQQKAVDDMADRMLRLGADGYYILHNHPSGVSRPSRADVQLTRRFQEELPGLLGHVVIDSNEYSTIGRDGSVATERLPGKHDAILEPYRPHPQLGTVIRNPESLAELGKAMQTPDGYVTIVYFSGSDGHTRAIQEIPEALFVNTKEATNFLRGQARAFGAVSTAAYGQAKDEIVRAARELQKNGSLLDMAAVGPNGQVHALTQYGHYMEEGENFGVPEKLIGGTRVNEKDGPYGTVNGSVFGDPSPEEAQTVQSAIEGKTALEAAQFLAESAPSEDYRIIAKNVANRIQQLQDAGMTFELHVAHLEEKVPSDLHRMRGITARAVGSTTTHVWVQGADVTNFVGTSYETVLHELIHAVTQTAIHVGNEAVSDNTELAEIATRLNDVTNAIRAHVVGRIEASGGDDSKLTPFERTLKRLQSNALHDPGEVISWALTNRQMQQYLESIPYRNSKSLWSHFVDAIRRVLGLSPNADTALSEVLWIADDLVSTPTRPLVSMARLAGYPSVTNQYRGLLNAQTAMSEQAGVNTASAAVQRRDADGGLTYDELNAPTFPGLPADQEPDSPKKKGPSRHKFVNQLTAAQQAALERVHGTPKTWRDTLDGFKKTWKRDLVQGLFDQYAPILDYSKKGYMLSRMSKGGDGTLEALMLYGKPYVDADGAYRVEYQEKNGLQGFSSVLSALQGEQDRFLEWVAAKRADRLKGLGLENLYSEADIAALKTLNHGKMPDGSSREKAYLEALKQLNDWNDAMIKIGVDSGLISHETRETFKDVPYIPFYRLQEEGITQGFGVKPGLVNQYAWKKLKGGTAHLNDDLLANLLQNWSHIITASAKNRAAKETLTAAEAAGVAKRVPNGTTGKNLVHYMGEREMTIPKGQEYEEKGVTKVSDGTHKMLVHGPITYSIDDPLLLDAVAALHYAGLGDIGKPFTAMKRALSFAVTVNPAYKIRNLIRDSIQAIGTSELSYQPWKNLSAGAKATGKLSETRAQMLAGGGMIRFGSMLDGNNADRTRRLIESGVDPTLILGDAGAIERFWKTKIRPAFEAYQEFGDRTEQMNRAALYEQLLSKGMTHQEATFWARDLMDFSMSGKWGAVRILTQVVPFMNARLQGLYKLGRATKADYKKMATTLGAVSLASIGLMLAYGDDDDWKKREDWDRENFWWFKIGDVAVRIPKPFEIGAMGTIAERSVEYLTNKEMTGKRFGERMAATVLNQLSMNPTPQLIKPMMDLYANKDAFTGRPIETMGMERLRKQDRFTERTSEVGRFLGSLGLPDPAQLAMGRWDTLSPVQVDSLVKGYFSWLGTTATTVLDYGIRPFLDRGERPNMQLRNVFLAGNFVETLPSGGSRYVSQLYTQASEIEEIYGSYRAALKRGDTEEANDILTSERDKLSQYKMIENVKREESAISTRMKLIERSTRLTGEEKREQLDALRERQHRLAQRVAERQLQAQ